VGKSTAAAAASEKQLRGKVDSCGGGLGKAAAWESRQLRRRPRESSCVGKSTAAAAASEKQLRGKVDSCGGRAVNQACERR
jgi:hypothetical protein